MWKWMDGCTYQIDEWMKVWTFVKLKRKQVRLVVKKTSFFVRGLMHGWASEGAGGRVDAEYMDQRGRTDGA